MLTLPSSRICSRRPASISTPPAFDATARRDGSTISTSTMPAATEPATSRLRCRGAAPRARARRTRMPTPRPRVDRRPSVRRTGTPWLQLRVGPRPSARRTGTPWPRLQEDGPSASTRRTGAPWSRLRVGPEPSARRTGTPWPRPQEDARPASTRGTGAPWWRLCVGPRRPSARRPPWRRPRVARPPWAHVAATLPAGPRFVAGRWRTRRQDQNAEARARPRPGARPPRPDPRPSPKPPALTSRQPFSPKPFLDGPCDPGTPSTLARPPGRRLPRSHGPSEERATDPRVNLQLPSRSATGLRPPQQTIVPGEPQSAPGAPGLGRRAPAAVRTMGIGLVVRETPDEGAPCL